MKSKAVKTSSATMRLLRQSSQAATADLTPMLDTIFLIILLLLATLMNSSIVRGFPVNLPGVSQQGDLQKENDAVEVSVDRTGAIYIGKQQIDRENLTAGLRDACAQSNSEKILVRADTNSLYGIVAEILSEISRGITDKQVVLIVQQKQTPPQTEAAGR